MREDTGHGRENGWHADVTWMEQPSLGSIAQLIEGTPIGGDILFSDSHACYLGLPTEHPKRIEYLHGINDDRIFLAGYDSTRPTDELVEQIKREIPYAYERGVFGVPTFVVCEDLYWGADRIGRPPLEG
jgi:alpha-ketoglutarate-dependent taurine dioxygenase